MAGVAEGGAPRTGNVCTFSLAVVWLAFFCDYVLMTIAIPIFPMLRKSDLMTGALFAAKAMCQVLASPIALRFVDRHTKAMLLAGLALESLSILIFACTFDYAIWFFARAMSGVASAAIMSAGQAHITRLYTDPEQRNVAVGLSVMGKISGVCLGPMIGGLLYQAFPSLPFLLLAAVELLVLVFAWIRLPEQDACVAVQDGQEVSAWMLLRQPEVLRPLGALMFANAAISCLESTIARYLMETFGFATGQVGAMFLLVTVPSCLVAGLAGYLGNWMGLATIVRAGLVVQGLATMLGPKSMLWVQAISLWGTGVGMGAIDGAAQSLLDSVVKEIFAGGTGKIFVLSGVAVQMGFFLGPVAGGSVAAVGGFGVCCLATGGALLAYAPLVRSRGRRRAAQEVAPSGSP